MSIKMLHFLRNEKNNRPINDVKEARSEKGGRVRTFVPTVHIDWTSAEEVKPSSVSARDKCQ